MSTENVATLKRMSPEQLSSLLLSPDASKVAVIDVRDDDYIGGHIISSTHVRSASLDHRIPTLVRTMAGKEIVIFHCALSQQRGPAAALRYMRERESKMKNEMMGKETGPPRVGIKNGSVQMVSSLASKEQGVREEIEKALHASETGVKGNSTPKSLSPAPRVQEVYVLDKGFVGWQEKYGKDERLTEAYIEDIWTDFY